jgi:LysM repeat protein
MNLFVNNAFAVYLNGELIGHIPISEDMTSEMLHERAVLHLEAARGGVSVQIDQVVTIEESRVPNNQRSSHGDILRVLERKFDYTIAATAIYVEGNFEALMRTQDDVAHLKEMLQERWIDSNFTVRAEFVDMCEHEQDVSCECKWKEVRRYVDHDPEITEFDTASSAFNRLERTKMEMYPYTVVSGDNLGLISIRFGTDINKIMHDNNLTGTNIFPGEILMIYTSRPLLSVRTYDEIPTEQSVEMPVDIVERPDLPNNVQRVIQYGSPGMQVTRELIIRENGVERHRETLEAEITIQPITHIIEQGTGTVAMEVR